MKVSVVIMVALLALASLVQADEEWKPKTVEEIKATRTQCLEAHPIPEPLIAQMKTLEFPDEEPVRQYLLCAAIKMNIFCTHEGYHADRLAKQFKMDIDEAEALAIAQGCIDKNEQGSPNDVWAYRGHKCLMASKIGDRVREFIKKKQEEAAKTA